MSERMNQEEFDARMGAGEDPYGIVADDLRRQGYTFLPQTRPDLPGRWISPQERELLLLLDEAVTWARSPSPIPGIPFSRFLDRAGEVGVGPRAHSEVRAAILAAAPASTEGKP